MDHSPATACERDGLELKSVGRWRYPAIVTSIDGARVPSEAEVDLFAERVLRETNLPGTAVGKHAKQDGRADERTMRIVAAALGRSWDEPDRPRRPSSSAKLLRNEGGLSVGLAVPRTTVEEQTL